ncbi:MAG TPA: hypothetical protein PLF71_03585 [bacterium]|nr:MAG: hypothetical protein BWY14_00185 [Parcubacteria group bacterium ADurb.Bin192]HPN15169.1 hypothetical protein [bacterium]
MGLYEKIHNNRDTVGVQELLIELAHSCQSWLDANHQTFGLEPLTSDDRAVQRAEILQRVNSEQRIKSAIALLAELGIELGDCADFARFCPIVVSAMDDHLAA